MNIHRTAGFIHRTAEWRPRRGRAGGEGGVCDQSGGKQKKKLLGLFHISFTAYYTQSFAKTLLTVNSFFSVIDKPDNCENFGVFSHFGTIDVISEFRNCVASKCQLTPLDNARRNTWASV